MSIVVTGGAGMIGSSIIRYLNEKNIQDIIVVDNISETNKWIHLRNKEYLDYINKADFLNVINDIENIDAIIHMGAQSATTEKDFDYLWRNNFNYTKALWKYCAKNNIQFIYASSAATYGDGSNGFDDSKPIDNLLPLNGYGYSKHFFDLWVERHAKIFPKQFVGLKFFNVYGPNEDCKGSMASMVYHGYKQIMETGNINLFKSDNSSFKDGEQARDFIYVKDICDIVYWFLRNSSVSGLYNIGTGSARTFNELAISIFNALELEPKISYISMPENLKKKYQYFTKAENNKLREVGYQTLFTTLEDGVRDYVVNYLEKEEVY